MQQVAAGGAAALDELQVDVGFAERGRAVQAGRVVAQRDLDQHGLDLADDLLDRRNRLDRFNGRRCVRLAGPSAGRRAGAPAARVPGGPAWGWAGA